MLNADTITVQFSGSMINAYKLAHSLDTADAVHTLITSAPAVRHGANGHRHTLTLTHTQAEDVMLELDRLVNKVTSTVRNKYRAHLEAMMQRLRERNIPGPYTIRENRVKAEVLAARREEIAAAAPEPTRTEAATSLLNYLDGVTGITDLAAVYAGGGTVLKLTAADVSAAALGGADAAAVRRIDRFTTRWTEAADAHPEIIDGGTEPATDGLISGQRRGTHALTVSALRAVIADQLAPRPWSLGDWVTATDSNAEGVVVSHGTEDISGREVIRIDSGHQASTYSIHEADRFRFAAAPQDDAPLHPYLMRAESADKAPVPGGDLAGGPADEPADMQSIAVTRGRKNARIAVGQTAYTRDPDGLRRPVRVTRLYWTTNHEGERVAVADITSYEDGPYTAFDASRLIPADGILVPGDRVQHRPTGPTGEVVSVRRAPRLSKDMEIVLTHAEVKWDEDEETRPEEDIDTPGDVPIGALNYLRPSSR